MQNLMISPQSDLGNMNGEFWPNSKSVGGIMVQAGTRRDMRLGKGRTVGIIIVVVAVLSLAGAMIMPPFIVIKKYAAQIQDPPEKRVGRKIALSVIDPKTVHPFLPVDD